MLRSEERRRGKQCTTRRAGDPEKIHKLVNHRLKIPMVDKKRSLNLSTSVSIVVAECLRQLN